MNMGYPMKLLAMPALAAALFFLPADLLAQSSTTQLNVQINVTPYMSSSVTNAVPSVTVTDADIAAGFKDYPMATSVTTSTNSVNGHVLSVALMDLTAGETQVYTSGTATIDAVSYPLVPGSFTNVNFPYTGVHTQTKVLSYRFNLNPALTPGTYNWPVTITASPY